MSREHRAAIAEQTLSILERGEYTAPSGTIVSIEAEQSAAVAGSRLYRPHDFPAEIAGCTEPPTSRTTVAVTDETTLAAARRLAAADPLCLNFASARNPGGGFLSGSQAQEESLARSSGLYPCIARMTEMYEHNRQTRSCLYSDHMIYSPRVPVFRDDDGTLLDSPYLASMLTVPAVNAGAVQRNEPANVQHIRPTMADRLHRLLWIARTEEHDTLVLGAWGCGVFGNDPAMIADLFAEALGPGGTFAGCFSHVVYAVYDRSPNREVLARFRDRLGEPSDRQASAH